MSDSGSKQIENTARIKSKEVDAIDMPIPLPESELTGYSGIRLQGAF
jgi:hypothetical protein